MPIISTIGRRSRGGRILDIAIHLVLVAGGVTMVYPFLIMLSGSVKSQLDFKHFDIIPRYVRDDGRLFQKYLYAKYAMLAVASECLNDHVASFEEFEPPEDFPRERVEDWNAFLEGPPEEMNRFYYGLGAISEPSVQPEMLRAIKNWLKQEYQGNLASLNEALGTNLLSWEEVYFPQENFTMRREVGDYRGIMARFKEFKETKAPALYRYYFSLDGTFQAKLRRRYGANLEKMNRELGTSLGDWGEIHLARKRPEDPVGVLWESFVRESLNLQFVRVDSGAAEAYQEFLRAKYHSDINFLNKVYGTSHSSFDEVSLIGEGVPTRGTVLADWADFVEKVVPVGFLSIRSAEFFYRDFLKRRYPSLEALNKAHGKNYQSFDTVNIPAKESEWTLFKRNRKHLLREFLTRNYIMVLDTILYNGRAVVNTLIYCSLSVLAALIVNPMAAYALSRFRPPSTYKILLFLMLTIAFPAMALGIPQFILMKKLGMLNTYAALILPTMASGYSIFLLKGFFDSLPHELFECASLDGASEWTMFWQIAMALSKPILAVIALSAFTGAYGNFMLAFIVCQKESMWTLMVHLYQLQQRTTQAVVFASLVVAALPTLLIFLFCQKIILRGIVIPTEK